MNAHKKKQQASDEKTSTFLLIKKSDFLAFLNLWRYLQEQQKELSKNQFRRQCQKDFLNYLRIREWQDIYHQIRLTVREMGLPINSEKAEYQQIHTALLSGLLSHIGLKEAEKQQYLGARNAHFAISPILCFQKTTEMGDGGRVSGNLQTLGAYGGGNRARMDRTTCRAFN